MSFILGISITLNILSIFIFFIIYKIGFKNLKRKIGDIILSSNKIDMDFLDEIEINDLKIGKE